MIYTRIAILLKKCDGKDSNDKYSKDCDSGNSNNDDQPNHPHDDGGNDDNANLEKLRQILGNIPYMLFLRICNVSTVFVETLLGTENKPKKYSLINIKY